MNGNTALTRAAVLSALGLAATLACGLASADPREERRAPAGARTHGRALQP